MRLYALLPRLGRTLAGLWAGALLCIGLIAAPAPFATLQVADAGRVVSRIFAQEAYLSLALALRLYAIVRRQANAAADSPERVALWLVDDEQIWVTLLSQPDAEKRHLAVLRLMEIRPEATNFDPYGDELYRQKQLAQLRLALGRP